MQRFLAWFAVDVGLGLAVWFGVFEGIQGALYLAKFFFWAVLLPVSLFALTDTAQKAAASMPAYPFRDASQQALAWFSLGAFIWHGHIATAAALFFSMVCLAVARDGVKKHRAANKEAAG